ncbi:MAG: FecR family protein, partial [Candidatus Elarobacter sp.]
MRSAIIRNPAALLVAVAAAALPFFVPLAARAGDGAGTGVARISFLAGDVVVQRGDSAAPVAAALNAPLLGADYLKTGDASRAEIQFDGASMVRLGPGVQMRFTHLDPGDRALQLAQGTLELRLLRTGGGSYVVDTPSVSVRAHQSGIYRISVTSDGQTMVTVRSGEAEIVTPQDDRTLDPGSTLIATGAASDPALQSSAAIAYDDFDRFNQDRDDRHERALADAPSHVDRNLEGIDALDGYGRWVSDGSYGQVWAPYNVGSNWAPYRDGRWVWEDQFGWTWVAYEPWGWAPYHYGRWYRSAAYGWCWYPPQAAEFAPVWQPGIVAFFTFGGGGIG